MPLPEVTVRRATLDDLEALRGLWLESLLPDYELEKRFTEFQVVTDEHGWILACLGLKVAGHHGLVHSLAIRRLDLKDGLLEGLWTRIHSLADTQGLYRLWVRDQAAHWETLGFQPPDPPVRRELPPAFGQAAEPWRTLKLREEPLKLVAAEEQLEAYLELERLKTERLVRRGRLLKLVATALAAGLLLLVLFALIQLLMRRG